MPNSLIDQGLNLMLYGMGTVFVFLTVMVAATTIMSKLVQVLAPSDANETAAQNQNTAIPPHILSAIEKAIALHRKG